MKNAEMKVVRFGGSDVIATSVRVANLGNNDLTDNVGLDNLSRYYVIDYSVVTCHTRGAFKDKWVYGTGSSVTNTEIIEAGDSVDCAMYNGLYVYHSKGDGDGTQESPIYNASGYYWISQ